MFRNIWRLRGPEQVSPATPGKNFIFNGFQTSSGAPCAPLFRPAAARASGLRNGGRASMDVILHAGAHRTASTSFQSYLRDHQEALQLQGIGVWGPWRTRKGLLNGIADRPVSPQAARRAAGRAALNIQTARRRGQAALLVSDAQMIGTPRNCLRRATLYPAIGERMARLDTALGGVTRVTLQIRALDQWWASVIASLLPRGEGMPPAEHVNALVTARRSWRHVITDLACACPGARILVTAHESLASRPDLLLRVVAGRHVVPGTAGAAPWMARRPSLADLRETLAARGTPAGALDGLPADARWTPFTDPQANRLRDTYADDLHWLRAGADGLATLTEDPEPARPRLNLAAAAMKRGSKDDRSARKLAP